MKGPAALVTMLLGFFLLCGTAAGAAEELYIITTRDGSQVVVRDYSFSGEYVEYTTDKGLPGFMQKDDFVHISNMIGVPPEQAELDESAEAQKKRVLLIWLGSAVVLIILYVVFLVYVTGKKKKAGEADVDIFYGRLEKEPITQGHLSFLYRGFLGRKSPWTIEVRRAYAEDGILFVEGLCTATGKRKVFRSDRVIGKVTDMSSDHQEPMEHFFADAAE